MIQTSSQVETIRALGIIANPEDKSAVCEFFELFKIPWEFVRSERRYHVVLCAADVKPQDVSAKVLLLYAGNKTIFDTEQKIEFLTRERRRTYSYGKYPLPIYGNGITFRREGGENEGKLPEFITTGCKSDEKIIVRIGYDLFREVSILLNEGQPIANGHIPTLDVHIALLRNLITGCGIPLVEIPPLPDGYSFISCLTHDVDHASFRRHKFDHTMFGFIYRSTIGSVINVVRGRMPFRDMLTNWFAAAKLPFIHMGIAPDFWLEFDRYLEFEKGNPSTFFFVPFENHPGLSHTGRAPESRATKYDVSHVAAKIPKLISAGCEIGLHGLDAWINSSRGRIEAERISLYSGTPEMGVRMHWLYWGDKSPAILEESGFSYDSTSGYNEIVGYRAGTSQVFMPLSATRLLELPMHVMDTALFNGGRLNLTSSEAWDLVAPIVDNVVELGGVLTVNWHDRSIAPERLWGDFYTSFIDELESKRSWFATASQSVSWFRKRRSVKFEEVDCQAGKLHVKIDSRHDGGLPDLRLRLHMPQNSQESVPSAMPLQANFTDIAFSGCIDTQFTNC